MRSSMASMPRADRFCGSGLAQAGQVFRRAEGCSGPRVVRAPCVRASYMLPAIIAFRPREKKLSPTKKHKNALGLSKRGVPHESQTTATRRVKLSHLSSAANHSW